LRRTAEILAASDPVGILLDATHRLIGTMRVAEILKRNRSEVVAGAWLEGEAWRNEPDTGLFVILEKSFVGMVPASEPHTLSRGDQARFRVSRVLADGKVELSLRAPAHEESKSDAAKLLAFLERPDAPRVGDKSDPDELRSLFGFSKKAFSGRQFASAGRRHHRRRRLHRKKPPAWLDDQRQPRLATTCEVAPDHALAVEGHVFRGHRFIRGRPCELVDRSRSRRDL
jgi:hypothetical protein